jgi:GH18 family chitinase
VGRVCRGPVQKKERVRTTNVLYEQASYISKSATFTKTLLTLQSPNLKVYIAVGGESARGEVFSNMISITVNRKTFVESSLSFRKT